ncbi:MAG: TrmJ/YjtD family RNA methyltransferase [Candidatus Woesearchaeota archaeon]
MNIKVYRFIIIFKFFTTMLSVILIEPEIAENIGFIARVMKNFEVKQMIIVNPKNLTEKSYYTSAHARDILENARIIKDKGYEGLKQLKKEFNLLIGTTGKYSRECNLVRDVIDSEEFFKHHFQDNINAALVLGRESIGLTNEELLLCDVIITIETSKEYSVMNVSHALAVLLFQYYKIKKNKKSNAPRFKAFPREEEEVLLKKINSIIEKLPTNTPERLETMKIAWPRILGKARLTKTEGRVLLGFFDKIQRVMKIKDDKQ